MAVLAMMTTSRIALDNEKRLEQARRGQLVPGTEIEELWNRRGLRDFVTRARELAASRCLQMIRLVCPGVRLAEAATLFCDALDRQLPLLIVPL